jgi:hypothetical protein
MIKPLSLLLLIPALLPAQPPAVNGRWFAIADFYGTPINFAMELNQQGDKFTIRGPRVESATHIMAQWLADDYKLSPSEVAQILGTAAEYKVSEVADRTAGIVLKINNDRLQSLTPAK